MSNNISSPPDNITSKTQSGTMSTKDKPEQFCNAKVTMCIFIDLLAADIRVKEIITKANLLHSKTSEITIITDNNQTLDITTINNTELEFIKYMKTTNIVGQNNQMNETFARVMVMIKWCYNKLSSSISSTAAADEVEMLINLILENIMKNLNSPDGDLEISKIGALCFDKLGQIYAAAKEEHKSATCFLKAGDLFAVLGMLTNSLNAYIKGSGQDTRDGVTCTQKVKNAAAEMCRENSTEDFLQFAKDLVQQRRN